VRDLFGEEALQRIRDKGIVCSGVTIGSYRRIMDYLEVMGESLIRNALPRQSRIHSYADQGAHNFIIHSGMVKNCDLYTNEDGPVLTLAIMSEQNVLSAFKEGLLTNRSGVVNVVHQYDRHPQVRDKLLKRLCDLDQVKDASVLRPP